LQNVIDSRYPASPEDFFEKDVLLKATLASFYKIYYIKKYIFLP